MFRSSTSLKFAKKCFSVHTVHTRLLGEGRVYDVVVVGGGHAGTEAAAAAARMSCKTLLLTQKLATIGEMSCNPSFGGIGKGHLMKEVDALDGVCAKICDLSGVQYKMLNQRKGPAVQGPRAQIDRKLYKQHLQNFLFKHENLNFLEASVEDLLVESTSNGSNQCFGVVTQDGKEILAKKVILTTGTFLRGQINFGLEVRAAGRMGDDPTIGLAQTLERLKFALGRLKTGTPPRLKKSTVNFEDMQVQKGDENPIPFSFLNEKVWINPEDQLNCHLTYTNQEVDKIVRQTLHLNRHVREETNGPRYCPSIESKILRFSAKSHQIWSEPEGLDSDLIYPQGLSCTMPEEYQQKMINCIKGFEEAKIARPGYGVEYDFVDPRELKKTLETRKIQNLYFAGQINGTTGYEEAAAQGIVAGINSGASVFNKEPIVIDRTEGYIGVLIDDLTSLGTNEPYRMFTTRAEFRLHLRPDNADLRLTQKAIDLGCASEERIMKFKEMSSKLRYYTDVLKNDIRTSAKWIQSLGSNGSNVSRAGHPKSSFEMLAANNYKLTVHDVVSSEVLEEIQRTFSLAERLKIEAVYERLVESQKNEMLEIKRDESLEIPPDMDFANHRLALSNEEVEKLVQFRPLTIAAASRIPGITPFAVLSLLRFVRKNKTVTLHDSVGTINQ